MASVYPIKAKIVGYGSPKNIKTLKRRFYTGKRGIVCQHDPRHVDVLVKDLGLEHGKSVQTPATPGVMEEEESEPLSRVQHQQCRSQVARCSFLNQDRADITFIVNELWSRHSAATGAAARSVVAAASIRKLLGMPKKTLRYIVSVLTHRPN